MLINNTGSGDATYVTLSSSVNNFNICLKNNADVYFISNSNTGTNNIYFKQRKLKS